MILKYINSFGINDYPHIHYVCTNEIIVHDDSIEYRVFPNGVWHLLDFVEMNIKSYEIYDGGVSIGGSVNA